MDTFLAFFSVRHSLHFLSLSLFLSFFLKFYAGFFFLYYFCDLWNCFYYFILSGAAGGLSTARGKSLSTPRHALILVKSQEFFHISYPLSLPLYVFLSLAASFFVRSTRNSYSILLAKAAVNFSTDWKGQELAEEEWGECGRVSCMLHGVCTIFLTSSQIWFLLFVVEFEMIMETFHVFSPFTFCMLLPLLSQRACNLHYALCWSTRIFG